MNYKIIQGKFFVTGYSPDGDSIRFQAANEANWDFFKWKSQQKKKTKKKQLRFEAIDALETHYQGAYQPRSFGIAALEVLLKLLGIEQVVYNLSLTSIYSAADGTDGFIASQSLDIYDRPVSLVFTGDAQLQDGAELPLADLPLDLCTNAQTARMGLVYPTFYSTMEDGMLSYFDGITKAARQNMVGLWALDKTPDFTLWNITTISDDIVILPKLFRRLTTFFQACSDFNQLPGYLQKQSDAVLVRSSGVKTKLAALLEINDRNIKFPYPPEDLIFDPKG